MRTPPPDQPAQQAGTPGRAVLASWHRRPHHPRRPRRRPVMASAPSPRHVATVWLLHQQGQDIAAEEGWTAEQAWQRTQSRQRAELFNPVESQIDPDQIPSAVAKWERLAGRRGACVAVTLPAAPWTGPDRAGGSRPGAAAPRAAP